MLGAISTPLTLSGISLRAPNLDSFIRLWVSLFARSPRAGRVEQEWQGLPTVPLAGGASGKLCLSFFSDVGPFLQANPELSPATNIKLLEMLHSPTVKAYFQIELAAIVDAGEAFIKATYNLEGDGPIV